MHISNLKENFALFFFNCIPHTVCMQASGEQWTDWSVTILLWQAAKLKRIVSNSMIVRLGDILCLNFGDYMSKLTPDFYMILYVCLACCLFYLYDLILKLLLKRVYDTMINWLLQVHTKQLFKRGYTSSTFKWKIHIQVSMQKL